MVDKVCIITGASSGIGKALAFEMAKNRFNVVLVARRQELIDVHAQQISELYSCKTIAIQGDVSKEHDCSRIIEETIEKFGRIDVLINNAGISQRALFTDLNLEVIHKVMDVNYWGSVYCTKYAIPYLVQSKGSVVAISSISGFSPLPGRTGYCSSKYALHGFMEALRIEHLKSGLHVMVVAPEYVSSEIRVHALMKDGSEQGKSPREEKRMISAEYVAQRVANGIIKKRRTMVIGKLGTIMVALSRLAPKLSDKLIYHYIKKEKDSIY